MIARGTARSVIAGVVIAVDLALIALSLSVWGAWPEQRGLIVANVAVLVVGIACLVGVIVLGRAWRTPVAATRPNRNTAVQILGLAATLQLVGGFAAMVWLGGFSDSRGMGIIVPTLATAVAVLALDVSVSRHVARTAAGVPR